MNKNSGASVSSHLPALIHCVFSTEGHVIEYGSGFYSTPILHQLIEGGKISDRKLYTIEHNRKYFKKFRHLNYGFHSIMLLENFDDFFIEDNVGVVFIDHAPRDRRLKDLIKYKDIADYIVYHDFEENDKFLLNEFKYSKVYNSYMPFTVVLSNKKEIII